ncbi:MAG: resolvase [Alphaproteobacteria bacterium CG_4_9_14_3_um_filter_47_13]|nr:MAG: resolvase [Alphaproteobacteria bacterium CG_4_9_14_3_um_filter_47_13]
MTKIAIYARYSSDMQSEASIEDQIRLCQERIEREGWQVFNCYTDHGISGASMMRPGIQQLMQDAAAGKFDIILAEALDRLSRDQEDIAGIYKRVQFAGVKIITLSEGEISNLHIGLKGTMNAMFLKDLADKTRRGLRGRVEKGKSGGGITYGYDIANTMGEDGEVKRGERTINEDQARIVNRIFKEYLEGKSPKAIAAGLNKDGIPGPTGKSWGSSTIYGNRQRGTGILNNELYIGELVWNRLRYIKDPDTGKRVSRMNPEEEWIRKPVPELRIVDQETWDKVKAKQGKIKKQHGEFWGRQRPRYLFSHLLKCGCCGGGFSTVSKDRYGCSTARNKGTCDNRRTVSRQVVEASLLNALQTHLMEPELCEEFCNEYVRHMNELRMEHNASIHSHKKELAKKERRKAQIIDSIADGVPGHMVKDELIAVHNRMEELQGLLEVKKEAPTLIHPNMGAHYRKEVKALIASMNDPEHRHEAAELVRSLVDKVVFLPKEGSQDGLTMDLHGDLAGILTIALNKGKPLSEDDEICKEVQLVVGGHNQQDKAVAGGDYPLVTADAVKMVAGVGFEPTTFRL